MYTLLYFTVRLFNEWGQTLKGVFFSDVKFAGEEKEATVYSVRGPLIVVRNQMQSWTLTLPMLLLLPAVPSLVEGAIRDECVQRRARGGGPADREIQEDQLQSRSEPPSGPVRTLLNLSRVSAGHLLAGGQQTYFVESTKLSTISHVAGGFFFLCHDHPHH